MRFRIRYRFFHGSPRGCDFDICRGSEAGGALCRHPTLSVPRGVSLTWLSPPPPRGSEELLWGLPHTQRERLAIVAEKQGRTVGSFPPTTLGFLLNKSPFLFLREQSREMFHAPGLTRRDLCPFYKLISGFLLSL